MAPAILAAGLGIFFLHAFYRAIESNWPEAYFPHDATTEFRISSSPVNYALFRFAPVYVTSLFVAVAVDRVRGTPWTAVAIVVAGHAMLTTLRASVRDIRSGELARRIALLFLRLCVTLAILLSGILALATRSLFADLVPSVRDIAVSVWTAMFAAILGVYVVRVADSRRTGESDLIKKSRESIPPRLWRYASECAIESGTDPTLVHALMVAENLQRPKWFRRLEGLKGKVFREGSYGIMQVTTERPISDLESIRLAVERSLRGVQIPKVLTGYEEEGDEGDPDMDEVRRIALRFNPSGAYADLVVNTFSALYYSAG